MHNSVEHRLAVARHSRINFKLQSSHAHGLYILTEPGTKAVTFKRGGIEDEKESGIQGRKPSKVSEGRGSDVPSGGSSAEHRQGTTGDHLALAEHMALEGHLPRVRARLRQEGQ